MSVTFDDLSYDVVEIIIGYIKHYNSLALLKMTCVRNNNHISRYSIAKLMLASRLGQFSLRTYCANTNCTEATEDVFYRHYRNDSSGYEHVRQLALNKTIVLINYKKHHLNTHYCGECFKNFVLVGELNNVKHNYNWIDEVNISYPR
jgi:hypothetical protein